jgi:electron transfer flavoprotein beta subunit
MKIAVCFKVMADYARLSEPDWTWDENFLVDTRFVPHLFNCFDESALEIALRLSKNWEDAPEPPELTALTVDDAKGDLFLKHLTAVGYHHGVRIQCSHPIDFRFNPTAVSLLIASYIQHQGHQLVILGMQGADGDNGQTGFLVAERLGWPCIREVTDLGAAADRLQVTSQTQGATVIQTVKLPMVLIMGPCPNAPYLRVPTLKQKLKAKKKPLMLVSDTELGLHADALTDSGRVLVDLQRPHPKHACVFIEGKTPREQAQRLYQQVLKDRLPI